MLRKVAEHLGTDHTELYVTPQEALNVVPLLPSMYDEPFADPSQIPTYLVSKLARSSVTVSLSGDGGDELFGGYTRYLLTKKNMAVVETVSEERQTSSRSPDSIDSDFCVRCALPMRGASYSAKKPVVPVGDKAHKLAGLLNAESPDSVYLGTLSQCANPSELVVGSNEPNTVAKVIGDSSLVPTLEEQIDVDRSPLLFAGRHSDQS